MRCSVALGVIVALLCSNAITIASPYDRLLDSYKPYMDANDPLAFPMKVRSLASDEYKFWRGSKDLFFIWSKEHCADWLNDKNLFVPNHGDLHFGNIGSYASEEGVGKVGFGMVDFDDSARMPFPMELMQGLITLELVAGQNKIDLSDEQRRQIQDAMFDSYKISVNSQRNAAEQLKSDSVVAALLKKSDKGSYEEELKKYTKDDQFRAMVTKKEKVTDVLDRVEASLFTAFADGIAQAIKNDDRLFQLTGPLDAKAVRKLIKDVVRRTRVDSSGSQGLKKYCVLLKTPFKGVDHDIILYLKQEIPSAAERSGAVAMDPRRPGERCTNDMDKMTDPRAMISSFCELAGESYWVHLKEPWSNELDSEDFKNVAELTQAARIWGIVAGATHRDDGRFEMILPKLTPALRQLVVDRAQQYVRCQHEQFEIFRSDPRTKEKTRLADEFMVISTGK